MSKKKDKEKKGDDKKKKINDKLGYIPPDLCEFITGREVEEEVDPRLLDDVQKLKFMKQINELRNRHERFSLQIDEHTLKLNLYPPKFAKLESDTNDITNYLNTLVEEKEKEYDGKVLILNELKESFNQIKQRHEKELNDAREAYGSMLNKLLPINENLKDMMKDKDGHVKANENMKITREEFEKELELKAQQHQAHLYEMEKENVREIFEIREKIPTWVKKVAGENQNMETGRMHRILNNYRLELGDLLKRYVGKPNQLARKAIEENDQLTKTVETNALNIKLILENTEAMMRNGDSDVHEMHDLASIVKENKMLLKSFMTSHDLAPQEINELKKKVQESELLVKKLNKSAELSKHEKEQIMSQLEILDEENFKLQAIIRSFQHIFTKLMIDTPGNEELITNLRVASCIEIYTEKSYEHKVCNKIVDPFNIFQIKPFFKEEYN